MLKDITEPISRMKDFWLSTHTFDVLNTVSPNKMICLVEIIREPLSVVILVFLLFGFLYICILGKEV